jgi:L-iditol 2-dehydrogenase
MASAIIGWTMRVAELAGVRQLRLVDRDLAAPAPGEVQVRVTAVGVCGSDMHAYAEGAVGDSPNAYPMVLGHEPAGVIEQVGSGVTGWSRGDAVACEPALYCYHCVRCMGGRPNLCEKLRFMSVQGEPGFFRERVNLPAHNLVALPAPLGPTEGALIEPLAVALHSLHLGSVALGETAVVFGAGPIGLLTVAALKLSGAERIWAIEPLAHRRAMAVAMGADAALAPGDDPVAAVLRDTSGRGVDVVFDCVAKDDTANQALAVARSGGRVVYTGIASELRVPMDIHRWRRKELALYQVRRSNLQGEPARDLLVRHPSVFAPLVTHRRSLDEIGAAFALIDAYADGVGKLLVCP